MYNNNFDYKKIINSILYISHKIKNDQLVADKYKTLKILYFAEKCHLAIYGRMITDDSYRAMKYGPAPSVALNIINENEEQFFTLINNEKFIPLNNPDLDELTESDIECLNVSIEENKNLSFDELKNKSHDNAYNSTSLNNYINVIEIAKASGVNGDMLKYIELQYENQNIKY